MLNISEERVVNLFNELKEETNNFSRFDVAIFRKNPQKIIILRLILNLSQRNFSQLNNIRVSTLSQWENKVFKNLPLSKQIENVTINSMKLINDSENISLPNLLENFNRFLELSKGVNLPPLNTLPWEEQQFRAVLLNKRKPNNENEIKIKNLFFGNGIKFVEQEPILSLDNKAGTIIADFLVDTGRFKIVLETCTINEPKKKMDKKKKLLPAVFLANKGFRIRKFRSELKTLAFIRTNLSENSQQIEIVKESFDFVVINDFLKLIELVKRLGRDLNSQGLSTAGLANLHDF